MTRQRKNIFLTGAPRSGKTTTIRKVIERLPFPATGFYTQEERVGEQRVGFVMRTLDGRSGYLARRGLESDFHIRRYGVSIENIESVAVPSISPTGEEEIIILDEIGKMECFSEKFRNAAMEALESAKIVIGAITLGGDGFISAVKERDDMEIIEVTQENRNSLPDIILKKIQELAGRRKD